MSFISSRISDGLISEPSPASRVSAVFPDMAPIKSYAETAADYYVVKPSSSFVLAPSDQYVRWNTTWGAAPSSCPLRSTMGHLSKLYGFESGTTWSPSCWNLECPAPGEPAGSVAEPFRPATTAFQPYGFQGARLPTYKSTGGCMAACGVKCKGPGDTTKCATSCVDQCLSPSGLSIGSQFHDTRTCTSLCSDRCAGDPNYRECTAKCMSGCQSINPRGTAFAIAGYLDPDICRDSCAQECSTSSDVNDCFLPCSGKCPVSHR